MAATACQLGGRFSRCLNPPVEVCQYCGRSFCDHHTHYVGGHDAICARKKCRLKHTDLESHLAYKTRSAERNRVGLCGVEDCGPHSGFGCSLCGSKFCVDHLSTRNYPFKEGWVTIDRPVSICDRCWQRRKIWRGR